MSAVKRRRKRPVAERLAERLVEVESGCIEWIGYRRSSTLYGQMNVNYKMEYTHRLAWSLAHGPIPSGMFVCHRCDNPPCCNVDHLFLGTQADNMADCKQKGRVRFKAHHGEANRSHKLTEAQVLQIRRRYAAGGETHSSLADEFGVSKSNINWIVTGGSWTHLVGQP